MFYAIYAGLVLLAAGIVLIPNAPLGLMTLAVQALAGVLLPSATVFLLLLCNDREVLGPWVNKTRLNAVASTIVGVLVMLSLILAATTLIPAVDTRLLAVVLSLILIGSLLGMGLVQLGRKRAADGPPPAPILDRMTWRMSPLDTLSKPVWSSTRKIGMLTMRAYLVVAVLLMGVKVVQLAFGQ
jgi:hypothetical protein